MATTTADNYLWTTWASSSATSTASTSSGNVWGYWVTNDSTSTATSTTGDTWFYWNTVTQPAEERQQPATYAETYRQRERDNRRQQAAIRRQEAESEKRYKALQVKKEAAEAKAKELLLDLIGPDQLAVYEATGRLFVRGRQHDYIIKKGGLVTKLDKSSIVDMCVHLAQRSSYPETDNVVGLKLALEGDGEAEVLKLANIREGSRRPKVDLPLAACM